MCRYSMRSTLLPGRFPAALLILLVSAATGLLGGCTYIFSPYYTVVNRVAADDFERGLIAAAEAACPSEAELADACGVEMDPTEVCDWSCGESLFKIPYAVTGEAVAYFEELIETYKRQRFTLTNTPLSADLTYLANVAYHESFSTASDIYTDVYVVTLDLNFSVIYGPVSGEHLDAERQVIFDPEGNLLGIEGDRRRFVRVN